MASSILLLLLLNFIQFSPLFAFYMIRSLKLEDILAMQAQQKMKDERELASRWRTLRQAFLNSEDSLGKLEMDMMDGDGEEIMEDRPLNAQMVLMVADKENDDDDDDEEDGKMLFEDDDGRQLMLNDGDGEEEDWIWVERPMEENNQK